MINILPVSPELSTLVPYALLSLIHPSLSLPLPPVSSQFTMIGSRVFANTDREEAFKY
jgi:hypothetical protein